MLRYPNIITASVHPILYFYSLVSFSKVFVSQPASLLVLDILTDPRYRDCRPKTQDNTHTSIVVYLVNPFSMGTSTPPSNGGSGKGADADSSQEECNSVLALIMCYQELLDSLPESLRKQTYLEIVPLHAVLAANSQAPDQQVL